MNRKDRIRLIGGCVVGIGGYLLTGSLHTTGMILLGFSIGGWMEMMLWVTEQQRGECDGDC